MTQLFENIKKFNGMYSLPNLDTPNQDLAFMAERLPQFKRIILKEVNEVDDIVDNLQAGGDALTNLTDLSDWLGDIVVYALSEMRRFGLPAEAILKIIMESNFSKLGADGEVLLDSDNKVMKGPLYWKPEPKIMELLERNYGVKPTSPATST